MVQCYSISNDLDKARYGKYSKIGTVCGLVIFVWYTSEEISIKMLFHFGCSGYQINYLIYMNWIFCEIVT